LEKRVIQIKGSDYEVTTVSPQLVQSACEWLRSHNSAINGILLLKT